MLISEIISKTPLAPLDAQAATIKVQQKELKKRNAALRVAKARERLLQAQQAQSKVSTGGN